MIHPFLKNIKSFLLYLTMWVIFSFVYIAILIFFNNVEPSIAIIHTLVFNGIFFLLGIIMWFAVRFSQPDKITFSFVFNQISLAVFIVLLWLGLGLFIMHISFMGNKSYQGYLFMSIPWRIITGLFFYMVIMMIYYFIMYYNNIQEKIKNETHLRGMVKEAELNMLKSQINPHFLFNSLNSISSLTITNPEKAHEMIIKLSDFLRYSVSEHKEQLSTFNLELENSKRYLEIEKVRFGEKLQFKIDIAQGIQDIKIPVMILQPLYENAVKHGVYESTNTIQIRTTAAIHNDFLKVSISNDFEPGTTYKKGAGIGLKNIRQRLKLVYQNDQLIKTSINNNVFDVVLFIPLNYKI